MTVPMGPSQRAFEDEIERDIAEWVGPQDADAYRKAMRGTLAYVIAQTADDSARAGAKVKAAWDELMHALGLFLRRARRRDS